MNLEVFQRFNGNMVIGDKDDEDAPMITIDFHNEFTNFSDALKWALANGILEKLYDELVEKI